MDIVALLMDFLNTEEKRQRRLVHLPMGRFGEAIEVAKGALFCESSCSITQPCTDTYKSGERRQQLHDRMCTSRLRVIERTNTASPGN